MKEREESDSDQSSSTDQEEDCYEEKNRNYETYIAFG